MYENTPSTVLEWTVSVPGYIPEQAVMFENRSHGDAMFVANVHVRTSTKGGIFVSNSTCAEYYISNDNEIGCLPTFDFLVLKHGEFAMRWWDAIDYVLLIFSNCDMLNPEKETQHACAFRSSPCNEMESYISNYSTQKQWHHYLTHEYHSCWWPSNFRLIKYIENSRWNNFLQKNQLHSQPQAPCIHTYWEFRGSLCCEPKQSF